MIICSIINLVRILEVLVILSAAIRNIHAFSNNDITDTTSISEQFEDSDISWVDKSSENRDVKSPNRMKSKRDVYMYQRFANPDVFITVLLNLVESGLRKTGVEKKPFPLPDFRKSESVVTVYLKNGSVNIEALHMELLPYRNTVTVLGNRVDFDFQVKFGPFSGTYNVQAVFFFMSKKFKFHFRVHHVTVRLQASLDTREISVKVTNFEITDIGKIKLDNEVFLGAVADKIGETAINKSNFKDLIKAELAPQFKIIIQEQMNEISHGVLESIRSYYNT